MTTSTTSLSTTMTMTSTATSHMTTPPRTEKTTKLDQIAVTEYSEDLPRDIAGIIAMAVVIPLAWISFFVAIIWIKKSGGILNGIRQPFSNSGKGLQASGTFEMSGMSEA